MDLHAVWFIILLGAVAARLRVSLMFRPRPSVSCITRANLPGTRRPSLHGGKLHYWPHLTETKSWPESPFGRRPLPPRFSEFPLRQQIFFRFIPLFSMTVLAFLALIFRPLSHVIPSKMTSPCLAAWPGNYLIGFFGLRACWRVFLVSGVRCWVTA